MSKALPQGVVSIRGKEYQTVALRVHTFRDQHPKHSLITEVMHRDETCVVMRAVIQDETGRVVATGHAEEYRKASEINRTSALENAETSAIGRALAAMGLGGTEFASADEVARAISGHEGSVADALTREFSFDERRKSILEDVAATMVEKYEGGNEWGSYEEYMTLADNEEKIFVWGLLKPHSKLRAAVKRLGEEEKRKQKALA